MSQRPWANRQGKNIASLEHRTTAQCPQCDKRLMGIPYFYAAVSQSTRTCPKCKTVWRILATPLRYAVTKLEWIAIS